MISCIRNLLLRQKEPVLSADQFNSFIIKNVSKIVKTSHIESPFPLLLQTIRKLRNNPAS